MCDDVFDIEFNKVYRYNNEMRSKLNVDNYGQLTIAQPKCFVIYIVRWNDGIRVCVFVCLCVYIWCFGTIATYKPELNNKLVIYIFSSSLNQINCNKNRDPDYIPIIRAIRSNYVRMHSLHVCEQFGKNNRYVDYQITNKWQEKEIIICTLWIWPQIKLMYYLLYFWFVFLFRVRAILFFSFFFWYNSSVRMMPWSSEDSLVSGCCYD